MSFLRVWNRGVTPIEAFTILGVSSARGNEGKIGQFGSGAKHGINVLLRNGINPVIVSNGKKITFDCIGKSMGNTKFDQVCAIIGNERKELGFALQFGEIDWNDVGMGIREFVSNAIDQKEYKFDIVDSVNENESDTAVYIECTGDVRKYYNDISSYFLHINGKQDEAILDGDGFVNVFRKGVSVSRDLTKKALFWYNSPNIAVDESRKVQSHAVHMYCAMRLGYRGTVEQWERFIKLVTKNSNASEYFEYMLDVSYLDCNQARENIRKAWENVYGDCMPCGVDMVQYVSNSKHVIAVPKRYEEFFTNIVGNPKYNINQGLAKRGYMEVDATTDAKRMANRVWKKLEKLGLTCRKPQPNLIMYRQPMNNGSITNGFYITGEDNIYISCDSVNPKVMIEEYGHYITGADDCTRDFQDWAFNVAGSLI